METDLRQTIYVIDEDAAVRDSMRALLEAEGYSAEAFATTEAFLARFHPAGDAVLLLDEQLPRKRNGIDLLETLSKREHRLPVIVITGNVKSTARDPAVLAVAAAVLEKPLDAEKLVETIRAVLPQPAEAV